MPCFAFRTECVQRLSASPTLFGPAGSARISRGQLDGGDRALFGGKGAKVADLLGDGRLGGLRMKQRRGKKECGGGKQSATDRVHGISLTD